MKKSKNSSEKIYNSIFQDILQGKLIPGEKLCEEKLAKRFKVSRTPVREAIFRLEKEGHVERKINKGCFIKRITRKNVEEILEIVSILEGYAAWLAAMQDVDNNEIDYLYSVQAEMEVHAKKNEYLQYIEKNREFHDYFAKKSGNTTLYHIISNLRDRVHRRTKYLSLTLSAHHDTYSTGHKKMIKAISEKNAIKARNATIEHNQKAKRFLVESLDFLGINEMI